MEPKTHQEMIELFTYARLHNIADVYVTLDGVDTVAAVAFKATTTLQFASMDGDVEKVNVGDYVVAEEGCKFFYAMTDEEFNSVHVKSSLPKLVGGFCSK